MLCWVIRRSCVAGSRTAPVAPQQRLNASTEKKRYCCVGRIYRSTCGDQDESGSGIKDVVLSKTRSGEVPYRMDCSMVRCPSVF